ncbi:hypothetical protein SODALDRAFT_179500 [Sodiomyces alkalinus F11]|uniref:Uncharacterized protein n=1 Tax=Sodiomyces alkalinus (strain CBS 110278 / VKM F-3762 / F11) TaxID=1314773 RepID=A0A3N2PUL8_SODAK|nr:hypothetical protein SODALDRAFT_179500 [Sodiomyces alkalinus F11]ROT38026.1 hypothetical protein SODALDRAFT_179500 [Sodiomyces alkalinus F11]
MVHGGLILLKSPPRFRTPGVIGLHPTQYTVQSSVRKGSREFITNSKASFTTSPVWTPRPPLQPSHYSPSLEQDPPQSWPQANPYSSQAPPSKCAAASEPPLSPVIARYSVQHRPPNTLSQLYLGSSQRYSPRCEIRAFGFLPIGYPGPTYSWKHSGCDSANPCSKDGFERPLSRRILGHRLISRNSRREAWMPSSSSAPEE